MDLNGYKWQTLPSHVLASIAINLKAFDLASFRLTCHAFNNVYFLKDVLSGLAINAKNVFSLGEGLHFFDHLLQINRCKHSLLRLGTTSSMEFTKGLSMNANKVEELTLSGGCLDILLEKFVSLCKLSLTVTASHFNHNYQCILASDSKTKTILPSIHCIQKLGELPCLTEVSLQAQKLFQETSYAAADKVFLISIVNDDTVFNKQIRYGPWAGAH